MDQSQRKGPTMSDYREDLKRFGPPPRFSVAERLATLASGTEARVESDPDDGTGTLVRVTIREVTYDGAKLFSAAAILGVTLQKESSSGHIRWYRILRTGEAK